jgi:hypothetical protein
MQGKQRVREHPRISAAKMGEFLDAPAHHRERILQDQKFPPDFKTPLYKDAYDACQRAFLKGGNVSATLQAAADKLRGKPCTSSWDVTSVACSISALEHLAALYPRLSLKGVTGLPVPHHGLDQKIEGVTISAYPSALLQQEKDGEEWAGALLPVFRKEKALTKRGGRIVADLLRGALVHSRVFDTRTIKPEFCLVVDVFHGGVHFAPRGRKRLGVELESACRQIAVLWPAIGTRAA